MDDMLKEIRRNLIIDPTLMYDLHKLVKAECRFIRNAGSTVILAVPYYSES